MILVYADNFIMAHDFMAKLSERNPELGLTKYGGWKYVNPDSSIRGYRGVDVIFLHDWSRNYSVGDMDDLNLLLEIGDLTNKTQFYLNLIHK